MLNTTKLSEAINEMGNALTAAEWPVKAVHVIQGGNGVKVYSTKQIWRDLCYAAEDVMVDAGKLRDCVNELCVQCGSYTQEHEGACDGCRWKDVKEGFR